MLGSEANEDFVDTRSLVKLIYKKLEEKELSPAERALLKYWEEVWQHYESSAETLQGLMGIYSLYLIPDEKIYVFDADLNDPKGSPLVKLFGDPLSLRDIIKSVLDYVKLKANYDFGFRTQIKGISGKNEEESSTFDVDLGTHEIQRIGLKRKKITSLKSKQRLAFATGPIIFWTNYNYNKELPNIYQSVKAAITDGAFSRHPLKISVGERHFRYPVYQMHQNFNIMLVLDVSNSIKWITGFMEKIISMLTAQANAAKDKLGLIVFQDDRAQILHYPTINVRHVIGTVNTLSPKGKTPLASGLKTALQTLQQSRFQVAGMSNAIVLLSDCFPEPITGEYQDQLDEPAAQAILHECDKIAAADIKFLIISPTIQGIKNYEKHLGFRLGKLAAERARGQHLSLMASMKGSRISNEMEYELSQQMMQKFMEGISEFRSGTKF